MFRVINPDNLFDWKRITTELTRLSRNSKRNINLLVLLSFMENLHALEDWQTVQEHNRNILLDLRDEWAESKQSVLIGTNRLGQPFFIDYSDLDRFIGFFIARQGTGKSVLLAWLAYYFRTVDGSSSLLFDPADEYRFHAAPLTDSRGLERLGQLGLKPCGLGNDLIRVKPLGLRGDDEVIRFQVNLADIQLFGTEHYESLLSAAMDAKMDSPAQQRAIGWLCSQDCQEVASLHAAWKMYKNELKDESEMQSAGQLAVMFQHLNAYQVFGDRRYDFLADFNSNKTVCFLGNPKASSKSARVYSFYATWLSTALYEWKAAGLLKKPVFIARDELSGFTAFPEGLNVVKNEYNFQRKAGNHIFQNTQFLSLLPRDLAVQMLGTGIVIGSKMPAQYLETISEAKLIDEELLKSAAVKLDDSGRIQELFCADAQGHVSTFYPCTPPSQYHTKGMNF
jgi:hypothetical protein